jgi:hypothetical protein
MIVMKAVGRVLALVLALGMCLSLASARQDDKPEAYGLDLPSTWQKSKFTDGAKIERVEYVYGDRSDGLLKVKKTRLGGTDTLDSFVRSDMESTLRYMPGYLASRSEPFGGGALKGQMVQFDFTRAGRPMMGRYYYLGGTDGTIWVLQFTGDRTTLAQIRNETDQIARSFREQ